MLFFFPMIAVVSASLTGVLSVVAAGVISFLVITLCASYFRFQNIVKQAADTQPEEMGASPLDILRVQLARYLAGCARRGTSFSLALIRTDDPEVEVRMDAPFTNAIKQAARIDDITGIYDGKTVAFLVEAEPEDSPAILARITSALPICTTAEIRVGVSSYPNHGLSGKELLATATTALEQANAQQPICMAEIVDEDEDEGEEPIAAHEAVPEEAVAEIDRREKGWKGRRKSAMLDELTGVLKPSAVSAYMQRMMSDFRHKKKPTALFCIGVNNMDHIARFHGEQAADDVLAGVSQVLQASVRADDLIGRHEKYAFLILAQVSLEKAEIIGKRISTLVQQTQIKSGTKTLKTTITLGVSAYPEHGHNLHHLYQAGQKVLDHSRANDIRAYAVYDPEIHDSMPSKPMQNIKSVNA